MKILSNRFIAAVAATMMLVTAPVFAGGHTNHGGKGHSQDIVDIAAGNESFATLVAAVKAADLVGTLKSEGPFTVFAPTNEAFAKLPAGTVENLLKPENKAQLVKVLTYHVVAGKVMAADVVGLTSAATVQGQSAKVTVKDGAVMIDNANVIKTDIEASNGVIHVIDSVILPK
ncbi:MAG: fasciclin domain-containing protein [Enterobacterales bacterium]|nr:fasciclin domain-containing protein [Enterobacterales bacterium]